MPFQVVPPVVRPPLASEKLAVGVAELSKAKAGSPSVASIVSFSAVAVPRRASPQGQIDIWSMRSCAMAVARVMRRASASMRSPCMWSPTIPVAPMSRTPMAMTVSRSVKPRRPSCRIRAPYPFTSSRTVPVMGVTTSVRCPEMVGVEVRFKAPPVVTSGTPARP